MTLMYVTPTAPLCLFIYVILSQRMAAVTSISVSFRSLKPMIFNTAAQQRGRHATDFILALALSLLRGLISVK